MNKLKATDALQLSIPERIQLVEDIWDTIANQAEALDLTEEEKTVLEERLQAYIRILPTVLLGEMFTSD